MGERDVIAVRLEEWALNEDTGSVYDHADRLIKDLDSAGFRIVPELREPAIAEVERRALRARLLPWVQAHRIERYDDRTTTKSPGGGLTRSSKLVSHNEAVEELCDALLVNEDDEA